MNTIVGVITARMASTRLPGKVLKPLAGKSIFAHHVERMRMVSSLDDIWLATSKDPANLPLIKEAEELGCKWYAGEEQDVVDRHINICERANADGVLRVTCDCPLFDYNSAEMFASEFKKNKHDYINAANMPMYQGTLSEVIAFSAIKEVHKHHRGPVVSGYIQENKNLFDCFAMDIPHDLCRPEFRLTVDEPCDYEVASSIYNALYHGHPIDLKDVYVWLDDNPDVANLNAHIRMKGCNLALADKAQTIFYSIVKSNNKMIILDQYKRTIPYDSFLEELHKLASNGEIS